MLRREKLSDAAAKTAISSAPRGERRLEALHVRHQHRIADAGPSRDARHDLRACRPFAAPIWARRSCWPRPPASPRPQALDQRDLDRGRHRARFVLQAVARADLDHAHAFRAGASCRSPPMARTEKHDRLPRPDRRPRNALASTTAVGRRRDGCAPSSSPRGPGASGRAPPDRPARSCTCTICPASARSGRPPALRRSAARQRIDKVQAIFRAAQ